MKLILQKSPLSLKCHDTTKGQRLIQSGAKVNLHYTAVGIHQLLHLNEPWVSTAIGHAGLVKLGLAGLWEVQSKGVWILWSEHLSSVSAPERWPFMTEILLLRAAALCKPPSRSFFISFSFLLSADWAYKWGAFRLSCKITGAYLENYNFAFP